MSLTVYNTLTRRKEPYFEDIRRLNVLDADKYPRVTENIPAIHQLIQSSIIPTLVSLTDHAPPSSKS